MRNAVSVKVATLVKREALSLALPELWWWRTARDEMLSPEEMDTSHISNVLAMVWHHTMPPKAAVRKYYKRYRFGPFYSECYMQQAIHAMMYELNQRSDLTQTMSDELRRMHEYMLKSPK